MNRFRRLALLIAGALMLLACFVSNLVPRATTQPIGGEVRNVTLTPADTRLSIPDTGKPKLIPPRSGFLEVHFLSPFENEAECVIGYPFEAIQEQSRILLHGESGPLRCFFEHESCEQDGCFTINMFWALDTSLNGEVLAATESEPSGSARINWLIDGLVLVYYSGEPAPVYTRENPMEVPQKEKFEIILDYRDGASSVIDLPKTAHETDLGNEPYRLNFVLHLE